MESIPLGNLGEVTIAMDTSQNPTYVLLMAHGAGARYDHPFLIKLANSIANGSGIVYRFNFPYKEKGKKLPGSPKPNIETIGKLISYMEKMNPDLSIFLSGKSYGGRMSSHWIAENPNSKVRGLVYFGFPLHAPGKTTKDRANHLYGIEVPQYFIQGTNDALANFTLIKEVVATCKQAKLLTVENGDHSFKVSKKLAEKSPDQVIE